MPEGLIALLPALIGAGTAATTTGLELSGAFNPGAPKPAPSPTITPAIQDAQRAAVGSQFPTLQSQVGGSVSPEYYAAIAQLAAGTANSPGSSASTQEVVNNFFGGQGGPSTGLTQSTGTSGGGLTTSSPTPSSGTGNLVSEGIAQLMKQFNLGGT